VLINSKRWKRKMDPHVSGPVSRPQEPARGGRKKWTDPTFQAQYSTPKTSKRWKRKMDPHGPGLILDPKNQQKMEEYGPPMVQAQYFPPPPQNKKTRGKTKVNTE
jgi:hypothetical protein